MQIQQNKTTVVQSPLIFRSGLFYNGPEPTRGFTTNSNHILVIYFSEGKSHALIYHSSLYRITARGMSLVNNSVTMCFGQSDETSFHTVWYMSSLTHHHYLRSSSQSLLQVPRVKTDFGRRAFSSAAPQIWNNIPAAIKVSPSLDSFKRHLKTHYFTSP